jgi:hypothetical protein
MKVKLVVLVLFSTLTVFATTIVFSAEKPFGIEEQKKWTFSKIIWDLGIKHEKIENVASSAQLAETLKDKDIPHKDKIVHFLSESHYYGGSTILYLISDISFPIEVYKYSNRRALGINSIASDTVFNTLKLNEYQRASKLITQIIFPYIKKLRENLKGSSFEYFIIGLCYGSKNFLEKSEVLNLKSEMLITIFSLKDISLFAEGQITDQDLIDKSVIYLSGRDDIATSRRIKINLQN